MRHDLPERRRCSGKFLRRIGLAGEGSGAFADVAREDAADAVRVREIKRCGMLGRDEPVGGRGVCILIAAAFRA
jgi:hypothetical protein